MTQTLVYTAPLLLSQLTPDPWFDVSYTDIISSFISNSGVLGLLVIMLALVVVRVVVVFFSGLVGRFDSEAKY